MGNMNVQQHKFVVKAGMTAEDVKNSKEATALQKKYASAFDSDGQKGFSQKEADLFNATTFSEKADGSVVFWARQKDGTKKGTKFNSKDNIQFKTEEEVKPYVKKAAVKKAAPKKEKSVSFFDEAWSGHQISKLTGDNVVTDWLQNKDKVCTDGKDDGKLSVGQYALSFAKGLIGGIPKAIINHPLATAVAIGAGAAAVGLTGGAILPVLGAIGVATGVGMTGYGGYKALTAKTDGEAKQALETMGMGVTTTGLSVAAADKALEKAAEAGVKSAQVSEDAGIIDKTVQMFKSIPECLTKSEEWTRYNLGFHVEGAYKKYSDGKYSNKILVEEKTPGGVHREYTRGERTFLKDESILIKEELANGTVRKYRAVDGFAKNYSVLTEERFADGSYRKYEHYHHPFFKKVYSTLSEEGYANGTVKKYSHMGILKEECFTNGEIKKYDSSGLLLEHKLANGTTKYLLNSKGTIYTEYKPDGSKCIITKDGVILESFDKDGNLLDSYISKKYNSDGTLSQSAIDELENMGIKINRYNIKNEDFISVYYSSDDTKSSLYIDGKLQLISNDNYTTTFYDIDTGTKSWVDHFRPSRVEPTAYDWESGKPYYNAFTGETIKPGYRVWMYNDPYMRRH